MFDLDLWGTMYRRFSNPDNRFTDRKLETTN